MIRSDEAEDIINNSNKLEKEKSKLVAFDIKVDLDDSTVRKYITLHLNPRSPISRNQDHMDTTKYY